MTYKEAFEELCGIVDRKGIKGVVSLDIERSRGNSGFIVTEVSAYVGERLFDGYSFESVLAQVKDSTIGEPTPELDAVVL